MKNRAFTLIELLVVIAIIAILAAILFPVFAQAKMSAKKVSQLSNIKQLGVSQLMYCSDYDDVFCPSFLPTASGGWAGDGVGTFVTWPLITMPYVKNINIFYSPADGMAGKPIAGNEWEGVGISVAANGYYSPVWTTAFELRGPMGVNSWQGWLGLAGSAPALSQTQISQVASTILLGEKNQDIYIQYFGTSWLTNVTNYGPGSWFGGLDNQGGWGANRVPDATRANATWPNGPDGSVTAKFSGQSTFTFADGHAKSMKPAATNPDPWNKPADNLWDGLR